MTAKTVCSRTQCNIHVRSQCVNCSPDEIRFAVAVSSSSRTCPLQAIPTRILCAFVGFVFLFYLLASKVRLQVSAISFAQITTAKIVRCQHSNKFIWTFEHLNFCILQFCANKVCAFGWMLSDGNSIYLSWRNQPTIVNHSFICENH